MVYEYEYDEEKQEMRVNALGSVHGSSIEDSDICMAKVIDNLLELRKIVRIVMADTRQYEYDFNDARMLLEIGNAFQQIDQQRILSLRNVAIPSCEKHVPERYSFLRAVILEVKYDPVEAYKKLLREIRHTKIRMKKNPDHASCYLHYLDKALSPIQKILDSCELIQKAKSDLSDHKDRSFYRKIFQPTVRPNFMYTRYMSLPPQGAELIHLYKIDDIDVQIYQLPGSIRKHYHIIPPEFKLSEEEYEILDKARHFLGKHEPREMELTDPKRIRDSLYNIGLDMLKDLTKNKSIGQDKLEQLAKILTRYTAGLGILEVLLTDDNVQDVLVNSPIGQQPIFINHAKFQECVTNIIPSIDDTESWATRFRLQSGRPLDEANPVLDTETEVPGGRARVAAITRSLSPDGLGFAFRRHREKPWTFPLFIKNKMMDPFTAGLLWFLVDGGRTVLVAGTRGSGKTSFLSSIMMQIMPKLRTITLEDTLELPVDSMRKLGYNIERLKSRSVITNIEIEMPAEEALRAALRLGDSCLIVGEVRSKEALALYEAMRIGALANIVAGTIHGASAYGVFDRVVNDLGVPATSFKATDIIIVCNTLKSPDGLDTFRRVVEVTEVRKHWKDDPMQENGFVNLMEYSAKEDKLKPSRTLLTGESEVLNNVAKNVKEWRGQWDAVWDNINLRAKIMKTLVKAGQSKPELLEASFVLQSNTMFHIISGKIMEEYGKLDSQRIYEEWELWLRERIEIE